MPKLEPKVIQKELEQDQLWPVYWLYGGERMKSRELLRRIRKAVLGEGGGGGMLLGLGEETFDATETGSATVLDAAQSPALGGGTRLIVVREAHALKEPEVLSELLQPRAKRDELSSVCVFISKDLDARKKFSKLLVEKAAVVPCEEVAEGEKEAWIGYLAKRRGLELPGELVGQLCTLDPWSLDIIDQELEKYSLAGGEILLGGGGATGTTEEFLGAFFSRDLKKALPVVESFADQPDQSLPLLGLFAWNVRHLALAVADREAGTRSVKINPYVAEKLQRWSRFWTLREVQELDAELQELDFGMKQTPLLPLGLWTGLVTRFCR